jgi:hypothetical protein
MTSSIMKLSRTRSAAVSYLTILMMAVAPVAPLVANEHALAQGANQAGGPARAENTQVVINGTIVNVSYDLVAADPQATFLVALEASGNGGKSYDVKAAAVSGDVGSGIRPGPGKKIVWEAAKDTDNLQLAQYRFRVALKPLSSSPSSAAAASNPPASPPASQLQKPPVAASIPQPPPVGGNSSRWAGLGMIAGGGALSVLAAAGPLRKDPHDCDCSLEPNKPMIYAGIGVAAGGALLMMLGGGNDSRSITLTAAPDRVSLERTIRFGWPGRRRHD